MKYSSRQYAHALYYALKDKPMSEHADLISNFMHSVRVRKDTKLLPAILTSFEKLYLKDEKLKKVTVESASPISVEIRKDIENALGTGIRLKEKVMPELLAGIKLYIDDEILIDASAKTRINNLFV
ncbi:MAG: F0F1 ATP synthase subunit delta [Patescibacteria group bacterium]